MRRSIAIAQLVLLALFLTAPAHASCPVDASQPETIVFSGILTFKNFPGPPNFEDVRKGDQPEPGYILELDSETCASGMEVANEGKHDVSTKQVQVFSDVEKINSDMRRLKGQHVSVHGKSIDEAFTGHHHAPLLVAVRLIEPDLDSGADGTTPAKTVVAGFYEALAQGDGSEAAHFLLPTKRVGGLSEKAMTRFYGTLREPLRIISIRPLSQSDFEVKYQFRAGNGPRCDGHAIAQTINDRGSNFISSIHSLSGC